MEITDLPYDKRPWKVLGAGDAKIMIAPPCSVKIEACGIVDIVPMPIVIALQTEDAIAFMKSPAVVPFMYAANDRDSRIRAARDLAKLGISKKRRDFVQQLTVQHGVAEAEAWELARLKFPIYI